MTIIYIVIGMYLGLFLAAKRWLNFDRAAMPWLWLAGFIRKKIAGGARVYTSRDKARDDARENHTPKQP
tara:strand:- start:56 stop:262 length:207 start_codon:yes stop_codon:yes gene_type:complete